LKHKTQKAYCNSRLKALPVGTGTGGGGGVGGGGGGGAWGGGGGGEWGGGGGEGGARKWGLRAKWGGGRDVFGRMIAAKNSKPLAVSQKHTIN